MKLLCCEMQATAEQPTQVKAGNREKGLLLRRSSSVPVCCAISVCIDGCDSTANSAGTKPSTCKGSKRREACSCSHYPSQGVCSL